jgi:sigma-B regulation protein RsbU (phosphoserine phosphatase)
MRVILPCPLVNRVESELVSVTKVTEGVARSMESGSYTEKELLSRIRTTLKDNPRIYGSSIALSPMLSEKLIACMHLIFTGKKEKSLSYVWKTRISMCLMFIGTGIRFRGNWGKREWSEPYYDDGGANIAMATCSVPFYEERGGTRILRE